VPNKKQFKEALGEEKYRNSGLDENYGKEIAEKLRYYFETSKCYLNPELKLDDVATAASVPRQYISQALNEQLQISFSVFVNQYRVQETKKRLTAPEYTQLTIGSIAFDSGFNSIATFNRVFKEIAGISPNEFKKNLKTSIIKSDK
jgi:AraC-like DNA-binding protein